MTVKKCKKGVVKSGSREGLCRKNKRSRSSPRKSAKKVSLRKSPRKSPCKKGVVKSGSREGLCRKSRRSKRKSVKRVASRKRKPEYGCEYGVNRKDITKCRKSPGRKRAGEFGPDPRPHPTYMD